MKRLAMTATISSFFSMEDHRDSPSPNRSITKVEFYFVRISTVHLTGGTFVFFFLTSAICWPIRNWPMRERIWDFCIWWTTLFFRRACILESCAGTAFATLTLPAKDKTRPILPANRKTGLWTLCENERIPVCWGWEKLYWIVCIGEEGRLQCF